MQLRTTLLLAVAALCTFTATADTNRKKNKKSQKAALLVPAKKIHAVDGKTFSYAFGVAQGESLKQFLVRQMRVDTAYIEYAVEGMKSGMNEKLSKQIQAYAAGLQIGEMNQRNLSIMNKQACGKEDSLYVDLKEYERGLSDAIIGDDVKLSKDSAEVIVKQQFDYQQEVYKNLNKAWLENNKKQKEVQTMPSGLQYRILTKGSGPVATDSTQVEVHYEGRLIDGTVFDSSYQRGRSATFSPKQVIKGWTEALTMMPEGSKWELYIPASLGYGESGNQKIPGHSTLIFQVEILKVKQDASKK